MTGAETAARANAVAEGLCDEDEVLAAVSRETPASAARAFEAETFHRLPPVYFIGDSRAVSFANAAYTSGFTSRSYQLRSVHLRSLRAADFHAPERGLDARLLNALATDQAVISHDEGVRWSATRADPVIPGTAPLVLFCGAHDLHAFMGELARDADIAAWDERSSRVGDGARPASRLLRADDLRRRALEMMEPLAIGIGALAAMGFDRIFLHGMPPASWGERFKARYGAVDWFETSHPNAFPKVWLLFDEVLRSIAVRTSARFVAGPLDAAGMLPDEATWDDIHYTAEGAREVTRFVVSVLEGVVE